MMPSKSKVEALTVKRTVNASQERVFRAWTTPAELARWYAPGPLQAKVEADVRPGGRFRVEMAGAPDGPYVAVGEYREVTPPTRLVFTWAWEGDSPHAAAKDSLVTVELRAVGGKTEVTLVHERLPSEQSRREHGEGWAGCLAKLEAHLAAQP